MPIQSPVIIFELVHKDLCRPHDLVNLEQEMEIFFLVSSWSKKVQEYTWKLWEMSKFKCVGV